MTNTRRSHVSATVLAAILAAGLLSALISAGAEPAEAQAPPSKIAFKSERVTSENPEGDEEIYMIDAGDPEGPGNPPQQLTKNQGAVDFGPDFGPDIAPPDVARIAFSSDRTTGPGVDNTRGDDEIFVMDAEDTDNDGNGEELVQLTNNRSATDLRPSFSPDGSRIVFQSNQTGNWEIFVMNAEDMDGDGNGDNLQQLTNNSRTDYYPDFSPDGARIAFTSNRDGDYEIYAINAVPENPTTNPPRRLTNNSVTDVGPDFSPDGDRVAFTSNLSGRYKIYTVDALDGSGRDQVTRGGSSDYGPDFSPDGTEIAFYSYPASSTGTAGGNIFTIDADGTSTRTRLTVARGEDSVPSWGLTAP